jgi:hypothetical protein
LPEEILTGTNALPYLTLALNNAGNENDFAAFRVPLGTGVAINEGE